MLATTKLLGKSEYSAMNNAPFLLPCCTVTPGLTHYFMVINHHDLTRRPALLSHQRKANSRVQQKIKLFPRAFKDVLASTAATLSSCPWYSILLPALAENPDDGEAETLQALLLPISTGSPVGFCG